MGTRKTPRPSKAQRAAARVAKQELLISLLESKGLDELRRISREHAAAQGVLKEAGVTDLAQGREKVTQWATGMLVLRELEIENRKRAARKRMTARVQPPRKSGHVSQGLAALTARLAAERAARPKAKQPMLSRPPSRDQITYVGRERLGNDGEGGAHGLPPEMRRPRGWE